MHPDAIWGAEWGQSRDGCILIRMVIVEGEGAVFGVNLGHSIVAVGTLLHSVRVMHSFRITLREDLLLLILYLLCSVLWKYFLVLLGFVWLTAAHYIFANGFEACQLL